MIIKELYRSFLKRTFDLLVCICGLIVILPIFIVFLPIISLLNKGPVFFIQLRPGLNGKLFHLIKIKTMNDKHDSNGKLLPDKFRLTSIGKFIRSLSLDELPQFINILRGDMSLVGPRPLLPEYVKLYNVQQARRQEVRPGMTGWAQVNGRNTLSWDEKLEMDVWYVDNLSFKLDMEILFLTIVKIIKREGINSASSATMERFTGSKTLNTGQLENKSLKQQPPDKTI